MTHLQVKNLSVNFGGLKALDDVSFDVKKTRSFPLLGPMGRENRQYSMSSALFTNRRRDKYFLTQKDITSTRPDEKAKLGITRTFQNIELFEHSSVLQNLTDRAHNSQ